MGFRTRGPENSVKKSINSFILMCRTVFSISHGFCLDIIFIQRVVCILSLNLGKGIENTQSQIKIIFNYKPWQILSITYLIFLQLFLLLYQLPNGCLSRTTYSTLVNNITPRQIVKFKYIFIFAVANSWMKISLKCMKLYNFRIYYIYFIHRCSDLDRLI